MEDELRFHVESYTRDLIGRGVGAEEAERRARMEIGSVAARKEEMRASLGLRLWDDLRADVRYAARMLGKSPGFTLVAVGSLALGIGANTAIFTLAKQVLLDRLAVPHPEQLILFHWTAPKGNVVHQTWGDWDETPGGMFTSTSFPYPAFEELQRDNASLKNGGLEEIFGFKDAGRVTLTANGAASAVQAEMVSGNYYGALGVRPALGRAILPSDDGAPGSGAVVVISDALWTRAFGRSPEVIGRTIHLNLKPVTIVGVNPPEFTGAKSTHVSPDVFFPFSMQPVIVPKAEGSLLGDADFWWMQMMGRVRPGVPAATAQAALDTSFQAWMHASLGGPDQQADVADATHATGGSGKSEAYPHLTLADGSRGLNESARTLKQPVFVLIGLAGLTLLLACANIANLLLARAAARQREMGVRMALGAGRARILRQVMTESLLLSGLGGVAGLALGYAARNVIPALLAPPWETAVFRDQFDWRVFAFTAAVTIVTGLLFGMAPALKATRTEAGTSLKDTAQTVTPRRRGFAGKAIVAFQVALSMMLVAGAVLFGRTLLHLNAANPGFRTDHLVLFSIQLPKAEYPPPADVAVLRSLEEKLHTVPGVASVTLSDEALISGSVSQDDFIRLDQPRGKKKTSAWDLNVGQSFFETMGIPIVAGRGFLPTDTPGTPKVAVINQALAREFFPNENPVGKMFHGYYFVDKEPFTVVGVSADTKYNSLRQQPPATYYVLYSQLPQTDGEMTFEVRTRMEPAVVVPSLRKAVAAVDRNLPLMDVRTQAEQIDESIGQERLMAALTVAFGVLALVLACIGIYGLMAYTVARRTNEIGLRLALGAQATQVMGMVLREALWLALAGVVAGGAAALALTRTLQSMLFGLRPDDPVTFAVAALLLLAVALLAGLVPARVAARVNPMEALRHD
jgi:predicted permease